MRIGVSAGRGIARGLAAILLSVPAIGMIQERAVASPVNRSTTAHPAAGPRAGLDSVTAATPPTSLPAVDRNSHFYLGEGMSGVAGLTFQYGNPGDVPLMCDWSGNGTDSVAVFRRGIWYVRLHLGAGSADVSFAFGDPGDIPVCGDWNGSGRASPGLFRNGTWYLRTSLTSGGADIAVSFGSPGDVPVVGRWAGGTVDTPGVVRRGVWYLRSSFTSGPSNVGPIYFGNPGDLPVVGDWEGTGRDTPGVVRSGTWFLRDSLTSGGADSSFVFGNPGDIPLTYASGAYVWGVDTTDNVQTNGDLNQTETTLGNPTFVGRYIVFSGGTLGTGEAKYIHSEGIKILLIVDPPNGNLTGVTTGQSEANQGVQAARVLGVPAGAALFRDIEASYTTDAGWIEGWDSTIAAAGYVPGAYENPLTGSSSFSGSYCAAVAQQPAVATMALWSDEPEQAGSDPSLAGMPAWAADRPACANETVAWQYLIRGAFPSSQAPNVDVDEFAAQVAGLLW